MKTNLLALLSLGLLSATALADGLPFHVDTPVVNSDSLRLMLSKSQIDEVSSTGKVTFTGKQLGILHRLYPKANAVQSVFVTTFNDNVDYGGEGPPESLVLWVQADEIAITIDPEALADEEVRQKILTDQAFATTPHFRISPDGMIYREGKQLTLAQATDEIIRLGKMVPKEHPQVDVAVAPPWHRPGQRLDTQGNPLPTAQEIFEQLDKIAKANNCPLFKSW
ncbi:MAG: hypothetical protein EOP85_10090 [Verrucomicrobiaceae bacterium]|nr:MAG: hypothetical protein EOP85_10090 [Verrucomicrobiaceae bacterium]